MVGARQKPLAEIYPTKYSLALKPLGERGTTISLVLR